MGGEVVENKTKYILQYTNNLSSRYDIRIDLLDSISDLKEYWYNLNLYINNFSIVSIQKFTGVIEDIEPLKKQVTNTTTELDWLGALDGTKKP